MWLTVLVSSKCVVIKTTVVGKQFQHYVLTIVTCAKLCIGKWLIFKYCLWITQIFSGKHHWQVSGNSVWINCLKLYFPSFLLYSFQLRHLNLLFYNLENKKNLSLYSQLNFLLIYRRMHSIYSVSHTIFIIWTVCLTFFPLTAKHINKMIAYCLRAS